MKQNQAAITIKLVRKGGEVVKVHRNITNN